MIKATITKDLKGNEYKVPVTVYAWVSFAHTDIENIKVMITCHDSEAMAAENMEKKTDKFLEMQLGVKPDFAIKVAKLKAFTDFEGLKTAVQNEVVNLINGLKLSHISKLEVL